MKIGDKIQELKDEQKVKRDHIASDTGLHKHTIKKVEDENDGKLSVIKQILGSLGLNKMEIVAWKETPGGRKSKTTKIKV